MTPAFIALGSNLQDPAAQLQRAVQALQQLPDTHIQKKSSIYRSIAVGPGAQPDYLNAVVLLATKLVPVALLDALQGIEHAQGRTREVHWGARTLDLDILLYGDQLIESPRLTIPHPGMQQRNFVLYPLLEISGANLVLPDGTDLGTLVAHCPRGDLVQTRLQFDNKSVHQDRE